MRALTASALCRHMERAIKQTKDEIDAMAKAHIDLAGLYKKYEADVNEFTNRREGVRKGVSALVAAPRRDLGCVRARS